MAAMEGDLSVEEAFGARVQACERTAAAALAARHDLLTLGFVVTDRFLAELDDVAARFTAEAERVRREWAWHRARQQPDADG